MADRVSVWTTTGGIVQPGEDFATASYSCVIPGEFSISAADGGEGAMGVRVVNELTALSVRREDSAGVLDELRLEPGGQADLTASGSWWGLPVAMDDGDVKWSTDPAVGVIDETGRFTLTKVEGTGGLVSVDTCKEQMLYEIHNPAAYLTPDCIADFTGVRFTQDGENRVSAWGAVSRGLTEKLKVNVCYRDSFITDCEISYGGCNALERARLAGEMFLKRLDRLGVEYSETREDYIGYNYLYRDRLAQQLSDGRWGEIRLHVAVRTDDRENAVKVSNEGDSIYTNGPTGGGGATMRISEIISVFSFFVPRSAVQPHVSYTEI